MKEVNISEILDIVDCFCILDVWYDEIKEVLE